MSTNPNKGSRPGFNQNAHPFVYHQPSEQQPPTVSATGKCLKGYLKSIKLKECVFRSLSETFYCLWQKLN
jgi:hypothetical protein